jgi:hypothetical protein
MYSALIYVRQPARKMGYAIYVVVVSHYTSPTHIPYDPHHQYPPTHTYTL